MGITVLSAMSVNDLTLKIATGDVKGLSAIKGLGKKTAERIVLELRDKIGVVGTDGGVIDTGLDGGGEETDDAILALMGLGFTRTESGAAVRKAKAAGATTIQQIMALALKSMR